MPGTTPTPPKSFEGIDLPDWIDEALLNDFLTSQEAMLNQLSEVLDDDDRAPDYMEHVVGRLHTLKGECSTMGFDGLAAVIHQLETLIQEEPRRADLDAVLLTTVDWAATSLGGYLENPVPSRHVDDVLAELQPVETAAPGVAQAVAATKYIISVDLDEESMEVLAEFLAESQDSVALVDELLLSDCEGDDDVNAIFRTFHTIKGVADFLQLKPITSLAHATEDMLALVRKGEL